MIVKLVKGPRHGNVLDVPEHILQSGLRVHQFNPGVYDSRWSENHLHISGYIRPRVKEVVYQTVEIIDALGRSAYATNEKGQTLLVCS